VRARIMYIENKSQGLTGPCRIGLVRFSKSGATLYYGDRAFKSLTGSGFKANYFDQVSGEQFWISGRVTAPTGSMAGSPSPMMSMRMWRPPIGAIFGVLPPHPSPKPRRAMTSGRGRPTGCRLSAETRLSITAWKDAPDHHEAEAARRPELSAGLRR